MKVQSLPVDAVLASLGSSSAGLGRAEACRRLAGFGPNRLEHLRRESWAVMLARNFTHFFAIVLWVAAALAFVAELRQPGEGMAMLGFAIVGVIAVNGLFSFAQEHRAERAVLALQQLLPLRSRVLREGEVAEVAAEDLVPGDIVLLEEGDEIPADCRLIEAHAVRADLATVTGESLPRARDARPDGGEDLLRARNVVLAGTSLVSGRARAVVFATGMHTEFGKIARLTQSVEAAPSPLRREIAFVSRVVAAIATGLGVVFFLIGESLGLSFWDNLTFAIGIIVANVPEGLLPTVTLAMAMASQRMARKKTLIRHLPAVEALGSATVICTDKTGTLTENRMEVRRLFVGGAEVAADGDLGAVAARQRRFFEAALLCENARDAAPAAGRRARGDPTEVALLRMARRALGTTPAVERLDEVPFDSERKRMSTLNRTAGGLVVYTKGALETVLPLCAAAVTERGVEPLSEAIGARFAAAQDAMAERGLRVLALAWRDDPDPADLESQLVLAGLVGMEDPPRPEVPEAIRQCREAGIRVIMVTGDNPHTALAIGREIGLVGRRDPMVLTGEQLARMSDAELQIALEAPEIHFARTGAGDKMRIVEVLRRNGHVVAVTGDGVNDAPALRAADIGVAMGIAGTDVAREAADVVLLDDNFASIVAAIEEGRGVFDNIRKFLTYILTSNVPEIVPYLAFVLFRVPLGLTILQILAVDLGTDMLPALGLGAERPEHDVMRRPPRPRHQRLLNGPLLARAYLFLGPLEAAISMAAFFSVLAASGWTWGTMPSARDPLYLAATTACLAAIVVAQVANVFCCRSERESAFASSPLANPLIAAGIALEIALVLAIAYTPAGWSVFATAPIGLRPWVLAAAGAAAMLVLEETRKAVARRWPGPGACGPHSAGRIARHAPLEPTVQIDARYRRLLPERSKRQ